jgi:hypothetical protein
MSSVNRSDLSRPSFVGTSRTSVGTTDSGMRISAVSLSETEGVETPSVSTFYASSSYIPVNLSRMSFTSSTSSKCQQARSSDPDSSKFSVSLTFPRISGLLQGVKTKLGLTPKKYEDSEKKYDRITEKLEDECLIGASLSQVKAFGCDEAAEGFESAQMNQENISEKSDVHLEIAGIPTESLDKVPSDLAAAFGFLALRCKVKEMKGIFKEYREAKAGNDSEKQKDVVKKGADCLAGGTLLVAGIGKSAVGITEQVLAADEALTSVSLDTTVAATGMVFNFVTGGLAAVYHSYKTYKYTKQLGKVNNMIAEISEQIEVEPGSSNLIEHKKKLMEMKRCLNTLIAMNTLGAAAGSLVVTTASLAVAGLAAAACCTGIGAGVVGAVVVGVGVYMICKRNERVKSAISTVKGNMASSFQAVISSLSNISSGVGNLKECLSKRMDILGIASTYKDVGSWSV